MATLTRQESQCAYWLSRSERPDRIAGRLGLSAHTVRQYIDFATAKLGARNRAEMVLRATALGLISDLSPLPPGG